MRRALIVGGTQFIGLAIARHLETSGWEVLCFHRGSTRPPGGGFREFLGDRRDPQAMGRVLEGGWDALVDTCAYEEEDLSALLPLLAGSVGRYLLISTVSVYSQSRRYPVEEDHPYFEGDPAKGVAAAYSAGKVACERALRRSRVPFTILRPAFVYGPWNPLYREAYYFDLMEQGRPVLAGATGNFLTQLVHADDLAGAVSCCLESGRTVGKAYNVMEPALTQRMLLEILADAAAPGRGVEDGPTDYAPWGLRRHLCYATSALRTEAGWRPKVPLSEGFSATYAWYLAHAAERRASWEAHAFKGVRPRG